MEITVADLMTQPPLIIRDDATIREALLLILDKCVPQLDVVDVRGRLLGSVTDFELLKAQMAGDTHQNVTRVMSGSAVRIDFDATVELAAAVFRDGRFQRLPVVADGCVVGQIERRDVMRLLHTVSALPAAESKENTNIVPDEADSPLRGPRFTMKPRRSLSSLASR